MPKRSLARKPKSLINKKSTRHEVELKWGDEDIEDDESSDGNDIEESSDDSDRDNDVTAEQKRKRLAKAYLSTMGSDDDDGEDTSDDDDFRGGQISEKLRRHRLEGQGKFVRSIADSFGDIDETDTAKSTYSHSLPVTCVALSSDDSTVYSGSKDNSIISYDVESGAKSFLLPKWRRSLNGEMQSHSGEVLCVAVSSDGKYIAAGGRDKLVRVFDKRTLTEVKALSGHRDAVTCLAFRRDSSSLYSGSLDRCIKHWDMNEMGYLETLFGHQDGVTAMDCWLKEKPVTSSVDRTVRVWKVAEESHLVFRGHKCCVDNVQYLTADHYASSGQDGSLCMWTDTQKKPVASVAAAHGMESPGTPRWISAMASLKISDLLVTGSHDGHLRFWKADTEKRSVDAMAQWRTNDCFINGIAVSSRLVVVGTGSEHRLGRWWRVKGAKNRVEIFKLPDSIAEAASYKAEALSASSSESNDSDADSGDSGDDN